MAAQRSLETVQHNIANADKPGYSRQRVELATRPAQFTGDGYIGQGVNIANVTRSYDQFINKQLSSSQSTFSDVDRYHQLAAQVDNMMVDSDTSLAPVMKTFFDSVTEVATDPASVPPRQVMLGQAETLVQSFHGMSARFQEIRTLNNNDMGAAVNDINSIASSLANLNVQIVSELGKSQGTKQPNDLLDQRDALLAKLSELVTVSVLPQRDGSTSVFVGSGQMLVQGNLASTFSTFQSQTDPDRLLIGVQGINGVSDITTQISGGALAGALRFRDEVLDPAQQKLGRIAAGLAMSFNAVHQKGFDLNGVAGTALFNFSGTSVIPTIQNVQNTGNALVSANYQDVNLNPNAAGNLDYSDFTLNYVNAGGGVDYTLTRARDNQVINLTATDTVPPTNVFTLSYAAVQPANTTMTAVPGIDITVDMSGGQTISVGDKFAIRPTYDAAQKIGVTTSDPQKNRSRHQYRNRPVNQVTGAEI
jgi:flagellar hook-associated protein FlgK